MPNGTVIQHPQWPPRPVHPGPEPIHPPWHGGPWECTCGTDPCTCGCQPNWSQDAIRCWNEMQQFRQMVQEIVQCELARAPVGITGVVDGSNALPGQVGEFLRGTATVSFAAYPAMTTTNVQPLVVPPGDWDLHAGLDIGQGTGPTSFYLSPVPAGVSNNMHAAMGGFAQEIEWSIIVGAYARGSFSVPTLMPFFVFISQAATPVLTAGTATMWVEARRIR